MSRFTSRLAAAYLVLLLLPTAASAQFAGAITGVAKDASGGVLPGVTVEVASPALIEKVRSVVTDDDRPVPDRRPAAGHVFGDVHVAGLQHGQARRHRDDRHVRRHGERRPESRRPRRDDHGHRRNADRRRPERESAADGQQRRHPGDSVLAIGRRHSGPDPRDEQRRRFRRHHGRRRLRRAPSTAGAGRIRAPTAMA